MDQSRLPRRELDLVVAAGCTDRTLDIGWKFRLANIGGSQDMEQVLQLAVVVFAALATGGLMVNWVQTGEVALIGSPICFPRS